MSVTCGVLSSIYYLLHKDIGHSGKTKSISHRTNVKVFCGAPMSHVHRKPRKSAWYSVTRQRYEIQPWIVIRKRTSLSRNTEWRRASAFCGILVDSYPLLLYSVLQALIIPVWKNIPYLTHSFACYGIFIIYKYPISTPETISELKSQFSYFIFDSIQFSLKQRTTHLHQLLPRPHSNPYTSFRVHITKLSSLQ